MDNEKGLTEAGLVQDRRQFLKKSAQCGAVFSAAPMFFSSSLGLSNETSSLITGAGDFQYEVFHQWAKLPAPFSWQTTHNVAVDGENRLYVIHEGRSNLKEHPSIFVFDSDGNYVRSFGAQFQGGGHGLEVRREGNEEFLYVSGYQQVKMISKMTLDGEVVWTKRAPVGSNAYHPDEVSNPRGVWGRDRFMPTNFAFLNDGGFLLADGYGAFLIHRYDSEGNWLSCFGGPGEGSGTFDTPHGIWIDDREPDSPMIIVTDRAHHTLQRFDMDGNYIDTLSGFGLPANVDRRGDLLLVPELMGRVSLLAKDNSVAAYLGDDSDRVGADRERRIRADESLWQDGRFVHPHDACFDADGNIFVAEWVQTGRVTKLRKLS